MDEEQSMFYFDEFVEQHQQINNPNLNNNLQSIQSSSSVNASENKQPMMFKAFNPIQYAENLPLKDQHRYLSMMEHNKTYTGLTHFVNFQRTQQVPEFMDNIMRNQNYNYKSDWSDRPFHLQQLFQGHDQESVKRKIQIIQKQIKLVNSNCFSQINISHVIHPNFNQNLDNFRHLNSHINFIKDLQIKLINFLDKMKEVNTDQTLIVDIYEFWMRAFTDFVQSVKKHTQRYTLSIIKKLKQNSNSVSNNEGRSTTSSRAVETQKRKAWKQNELQILQKIITSNSTFNQSAINKVAEELNRTPASITSKIQKIIKEHKNHNPDFQIHESTTIFDKIINILKKFPEGLTRQSVISKLDQYYEMGQENSNWAKSAAQILSSRTQIIKIKGTYSLIGIHKFDMSKKSFKDKVVNCLLSISERKGDLKRIVDQYICLYGKQQGIQILSQQRRKSLEASISKSLCRYDIFNKENSRTVYRLKRVGDERQIIDQQINKFIQ